MQPSSYPSNQLLIIAKYTLIEAYRRSFILLFLIGIMACVALAAYAASLALADKQATLAAFYAAAVRMMGVMVTGVYLILTEIRNLESGNAFIWLGLPISRLQYLLEKLLAYSVLVSVLVLFIALPLFWMGTESAVILRWLLGFYFELLIVVALSLLLSCLFRQALISLFAFMPVYLFARSALEFYHYSSNIITSGGGGFEPALAWFIKLSTFLVPKLELFASAGWILHNETPGASLSLVWPQALLFFALLIVIALDRLNRRGF